MVGIESELLRPALELVLTIARRDAAAHPPMEPPRSLRVFLRLQRLSTTALGGVRRAADAAPSTLARAADAAPTEEEAGGRAPWLFLHRPEGWEDELASLVAAASEQAAESSAQRRVARLEAEVSRSTAALAATTAEAEQLRAALASASSSSEDAESRRRAAEAARAELAARVRGLEAERDAAHQRASRFEKLAAGASANAGAEATAAVPAEPAIDLDHVRRTLASAAEALASAQAAIAEVVDLVGGDVVASDGGPVAPSAPRVARARTLRPRGSVRLPAPLPPGVFEEERAAAEHLVRLPSAVLVVDGYNASLRRWSGVPIAEQRSRLTDALAALAARTGVGVEVVFDGDDEQGALRTVAGRPRGLVRVAFSPGTVEADEVILDRVERLPLANPVIVATDDRRVRREAAARGANLVTSVQLFQLLGLDLDR